MKRTKIVATISDKRCDVGFLKDLYEAGMNVVRLNTAHQTLDEAMNGKGASYVSNICIKTVWFTFVLL